MMDEPIQDLLFLLLHLTASEVGLVDTNTLGDGGCRNYCARGEMVL